MFGFDPSKMDPKVLMEVSELIRQLPPEQISKMQTLTHNMMAGFDVRKEMEEFERSLPPGFREKLVGLMAGSQGGFAQPSARSEAASTTVATDTLPGSVRDARLTVLRAVAEGSMTPEDAEKILFET